MDINRDGSITADELQRSLTRIWETGTHFTMKTIELLIDKYDTNGDREISFDEFASLYQNLNEEHAAFLLVDSDGNGTIDLEEFKRSFQNKGYHDFKDKFYNAIMKEVEKRTGVYGIKFDIFIRVRARFNFLRKKYRNTLHSATTLEDYLVKNFFENFW